MAAVQVCGYNKFGFCKYLDTCKFRHIQIICETSWVCSATLESDYGLGWGWDLAISNICDGWVGWYTLMIIMPLLRHNPLGFFPQGRVWQN